MLRKVGGPSLQRLQPTAAFEEHARVASKLMELAARTQAGGASSIMFLPQAGVSFEAFAFAFHTGLPKELNVTRAPGKVLRGTIVINVSGHVSGGPQERLLGHVERELARQGVHLGDDARRFLALRDTCAAAFLELGRGKGGATVHFEGHAVPLPRALFHQLQRAGADPELHALVELGDLAQRRLFGAENSYQVRIRTPDGKLIELNDVPRNQPSKIELATRIPVELPLLPGETLLEAWPKGSSEAAGYVEARRYRIHFGKDLFDASKAEAVAESYQAAHPSIRWGTRHENDDLEAQQVSPSPRPYQDF